MTSELQSLLERVEKATGPDRVLDVRIQRMKDAEPLPSEDDAELAELMAAYDARCSPGSYVMEQDDDGAMPILPRS